jgi:AcrR family transcriptional regulator
MARSKAVDKVANKVGRPQGRQPSQTRESILIAARSCFAENGYGATTFKQVAKRAGLTPAALYTHFSSKPDLYLSTIEFSYTPILPGFKAAFEIDAPFKEKLGAILKLAVDLYEEDRTTLAFILGAHLEAKRHPDIADYEDRDYYKIASTILRSVFQQAIDNGDVPPHFSVDDLMLTFIGGTMGMATFASAEGIQDKTSLRKGVEVMLAALKW